MNRAGQQGAALVVAMLVLSLVVVFASSMAFDYQFSIRRVSNQMLMQQGYQYLLATEAFAGKALMQDLQNDSDDNASVDHRGELWAQEGLVFSLEDGAYTGQLFDLQGRFNLNNLQPPPLADGQYPPAVPYTISQGIFMRLLQAISDEDFQLDEMQAKSITEAVVDWLDADNQSRGFDCGEDDSYYRLDDRPPQRVANGPFASVSELRLICNLPLEAYLRLRPLVTVWPQSGKSSININTASPALLRSIFVSQSQLASLQAIDNKSSYQAPPPLSEEQLTTLLEVINGPQDDDAQAPGQSLPVLPGETEVTPGYTSLTAVANDLGSDLAFWPNADIGLYSDFFLLQSTVELGGLTQTMGSVISRQNGSIQILARSTGGL